MSFHEGADGSRWCACFQAWQPASEARTCAAGGCPELQTELIRDHCYGGDE